MEFLDLEYLLFSGIFLSGIGGYPPPPLTENHPAQKPLAEMGGTHPPLTEKIRLVIFDSAPKKWSCKSFGGIKPIAADNVCIALKWMCEQIRHEFMDK